MGYTFYYFNLYVRGEPVRMLLSKGGVAFEDKRIDFGEWPALKAGMPNGQVPALKLDDGTIMGESLCIIRYLAQTHGFYPNDPREAAIVEEGMEAYQDLIGKIYKPFFASSEAEKEGLINGIFDNTMPAYLKAIDGELTKGTFYGGLSKITAADFCVGGVYTNFAANPNVGFAKEKWAALLEQYPNFKAYGERFSAEMKAYLSSRPAAPI